MNTIVVVTERQEDFTLFTANFSHLPVHFSWNTSMQDALDEFSFEQPFIVFVVSKDIEQLQGWVQVYDSSKYQKPLVVFTGSLEWTERDMLWRSGVSDIVELPRSKKELEYILNAFMVGAVSSGKKDNEMQGRLQDLSITDIIDTFDKSSRSGFVLVENDTQKGQLEFYNGKLVNATLPECDPLESVCVMATWEEGVFFSRFDRDKHKERILLDNDQVILECKNYKKSYKQYHNQLPEKTTPLYTDPDLAYEEFGPKDRKIMQQFRNGLSLEDFLRGYTGSLNFILKKIILWLDRKWLLTEDDFRLLKARLKAEERRSAIGKLFDKIFPGKPDHVAEDTHLNREVEEEEFMSPEIRFPSLYCPEMEPNLQKRIWEIPIVVTSDREEELLLQGLEVREYPFLRDIKIVEKETDDALLMVYILNKALSKSSLKDFDPLLRKAPFVLILFESENALVQSVITRIGLRYELDIFFLSSKPIEDDGDIESLKSLTTIPVEKLVLFDSLNNQKLTQIHWKAQELFAASNEAENVISD